MPYQFYLVLHFLGIFLILLPLGGMCFHMAAGGTRAWPLRKFAAMLHGIGLLIVLIAGFGLLAKLHLGFPVWAMGKLAIWLVLGGIPALIYRKGQMAKTWLFLILVLAVLAGGLAAYKPGQTYGSPAQDAAETATTAPAPTPAQAATAPAPEPAATPTP